MAELFSSSSIGTEPITFAEMTRQDTFCMQHGEKEIPLIERMDSMTPSAFERHMYTRFREADLNRDGTLSKDEFDKALKGRYYCCQLFC